MKTLIKVLGWSLLIYFALQYFSNRHHYNTTDKDYMIEVPEIKLTPKQEYERHQLHPKNLKKIPPNEEIHDNEPQFPDDAGNDN
jgi:hypothetical protein